MRMTSAISTPPITQRWAIMHAVFCVNQRAIAAAVAALKRT